ncbi:MAG: (Fe-S)-binding protein [Candidatus Woesearchaeota archaeon]
MTKEKKKSKEDLELKEALEKCTLCGFCNIDCPVFKVLREEESSARGRMFMLKEEIYEELLYLCTLCKSCEKKCINGIKLTELFLKARKKYPRNEKLMENLRKTNNAIGESDEWYCC